MELATPLQNHLDRAAGLHSALCPKQVIGVRMARLACRLLGVDPDLPENRRRLFVFMEIGYCVADGVSAVTRARPTNNLMKLVDYGRVAATFVDLQSGRAVRLSERPDSRDAAQALYPTLSAWHAQLVAYQGMADDLLFIREDVTLREPVAAPGEPYSVVCESCGGRVHEHHEVVIGGRTLCKPCAGTEPLYYSPAGPDSAPLAESAVAPDASKRR